MIKARVAVALLRQLVPQLVCDVRQDDVRRGLLGDVDLVFVDIYVGLTAEPSYVPRLMNSTGGDGVFIFFGPYDLPSRFDAGDDLAPLVVHLRWSTVRQRGQVEPHLADVAHDILHLGREQFSPLAQRLVEVIIHPLLQPPAGDVAEPGEVAVGNMVELDRAVIDARVDARHIDGRARGPCSRGFGRAWWADIRCSRPNLPSVPSSTIRRPPARPRRGRPSTRARCSGRRAKLGDGVRTYRCGACEHTRCEQDRHMPHVLTLDPSFFVILDDPLPALSK